MNKKAEREREKAQGPDMETWRLDGVCMQKLQQMEIWGQEIFWGS